MIPFPGIDPVAFMLGPVAVHWYGLAYLAGIGLGWLYLDRQAQLEGSRWARTDVENLVFYTSLGAILGGRIGYILFYQAAQFLETPAMLFMVWRGGMSFHGGCLGVIVALGWYARVRRVKFLLVSDFILPVVPIGLGLGRLANFVNQELWGAPTHLPWGVVFSHPAAGVLPRHPSQLYEALLEGVCLFIVLRLISRQSGVTGTVTGWFLILYAAFRSAIELVREPDAHIGYLGWGWVTMGQVLSLPMLIVGLVILFSVSSRN